METVLGLFTGSSKWLYIALVALSIAFIGVSSLSISLHADKSALNATIELKDKDIKEKNELINVQAEKVKKLTADLAQTKADLQTQNALNEQYSIDIQKKEKKYQEVMAKKPTFRTQYVPADRTNNEAQDLLNFVKKWRTQK